jgi:N12 class adenine-specific DNA methylase
MGYNVAKKLEENIAAVELGLNWTSGDKLESSQLDILKRFSGFGGIKAIKYSKGPVEGWQNPTEEDIRLHSRIMKLHEILENALTPSDYQAVFQSIKESSLTAFYTPPVVPKTLFEVLKDQGVAPRRLYDPSSGAGIFARGAQHLFPSLEEITAVEKDTLTGKVLAPIMASLPVRSKVYVKGFEETPNEDNGNYDLIASNIPFGSFQIFDPKYQDKALTGRIHNYFFAKGIDKIGDGGLLAFITSDSFLNSPGNIKAREYLFTKADFISLAVLPDNLMKDTGNTESPSHLLIVQKRENKESVSEEERYLISTVERSNEFGPYNLNEYISLHPEIIVGDEVRAGKNQYGLAHETIWQRASMEEIAGPLSNVIREGLERRFNKEVFERLQASFDQKKAKEKIVAATEGKKARLTFLETPERKTTISTAQLGVFDLAPSDAISQASAYLSESDEALVHGSSAKVISIIRTEDRPDHDSIIVLTAKAKKGNNYRYKFFSNLKEVQTSKKWMDGSALRVHMEGLAKDLKKYEHGFVYSGEESLEVFFEQAGEIPRVFSGLKSFYKDGTLVSYKGHIGRIKDVDKGNNQATFESTDVSQSDRRYFERYILLRDGYFDLYERESLEQREFPDLRNEVNKRYDEFTNAYGLLNASENEKLKEADQAHGAVVISSVERKEDNRFVKADILNETLVAKRENLITDDPAEALARCLNDEGKVDIQYISTMIGKDEVATIEALGDLVFLNPVSLKWQTADDYLSGNVVTKLQAAEAAAAEHPENSEMKRSLEAIKKVLPQAIPYELLDFNLGERWLPERYYSDFATELFGEKTRIDFYSSVDMFKVKPDARNVKITEEFAILPKSGHKMYGNILLEHALENTSPAFSYEIDGPGDTKIRMPDNEATQLAHQKIESIRARFVEWMRNLPESEKASIAKRYNDSFNCYVLREFKGDHLRFPGLNKEGLGIPDLFASQKSAVWRIVQNRGALVDHEVGLGKTLTMIVAAHEMKRLGIVHKPMIIGLKANVSEIAETYRTAYPNARILFPGKDDFSPANRKRLFQEIKNNNWDCVIISHDQFGKIPQSPEVQKEILGDELNNLDNDLKTLEQLGEDINKGVLKGLQVRRMNLSAKLSEAVAKIDSKTDEDINFRDMGIDHLLVDESHKFKNLMFTTRHNRVAGLGNMQGSQKAMNMLFAVRSLQKHFDADLCATFVSGTPISNSLTEMYLIFKYLRPKELERQRVENFDGWASVFAKKTVDFEFSVTNQIVAKERFRHFIKVPELALFYNEITDYKTAKHIKLDKPTLDEQLVNIAPTPDQQEFVKKLIEFAKTGNAALIGRQPLSPEEDTGRMLIATNYAKKMSADMRLISDEYDDHPNNKVNVCARKVAEIYRESTPHKGTQIIFSDLGTPKSNEFNLYDALRDKLVQDFDIPPYEITFIHDWTDSKRPDLFKKMNRGEIRILLGSTDKAGTGVNIQRKMVAMHHLDIPWKPSELEQRNGRGARQGNIVAKEHYGNKVRGFIYAVEQTLDAYKFNLLKNKQTFIDQMKNSALHTRTLDEGAMDEQGGMNFSEYIAILSGDTTLLEKARLSKKVGHLESLRGIHFKEIARSKQRIEVLRSEKESATATVAKLQADQSLYKSNLRYEKDGTKMNPIRLIHFGVADPEGIGRYLIDYFYQFKPTNGTEREERIGELYGFELYVRCRPGTNFSENGQFQNDFYAVNPETGIKYNYNSGQPNVDNPKVTARNFISAIDRIDHLLEKHQGDLTKIEREIPTLESLINKPFDREEELKSLKAELASLDVRIAMNLKGGEETGHDVVVKAPIQGEEGSAKISIRSKGEEVSVGDRRKAILGRSVMIQQGDRGTMRRRGKKVSL